MHVPGAENVVGDTLSRQYNDEKHLNTIVHLLSDIDLELIAQEQSEQEESENSLDLQWLTFPGTSSKALCDILQNKPRVFLLETWCKKVFGTIHLLAHPLAKAMLQSVVRDYVWPGMKRDERAKECEKCSLAKITRHVNPHIQSIKCRGIGLNAFTWTSKAPC